ncbi:MAG: chromosome segregation protein SMC [Peptostreptococcus sp.]|uniref:chromosome segregation protein SMC n=1 Tax=Peptostreptococcus sp. TaxID=1262 RepID=UPI002FC6FD6D
MYLKKLSLKGFKSFPVKTDIFFEEGITAIVGPNGSGKSNISDAIRWVLGEQSVKSLRGEKMEDVIFSGTDSKKQLNYCEVALTLDNQLGEIDIDSDELVVKRRAYRTGESEYYIDGKSCRLKDVKETLMDTGIGKDGYSIIEQGKVDEILSNNPANRRKIFDEACGIAKYRYRKNEAEKNLTKSSENLARIVDIFTEIENQLEPLQKQEEKAKKYLTLSEELKKQELNDIIAQHSDYENTINDLTFEVNEIDKVLENQDREKEKLEIEISEFEKDIRAIEIHIEELNKQAFDINDSVNMNKSDSEITLEKIKNYTNNIDRNIDEVDIINKKILLAKKELEKANNKANENSYIIEDFEKELDSIYEKKRASELKLNKLNSELEENKTLSITFLRKREEISNNLAKVSANIENINSKILDLQSNIENYEEESNTIECDMKEKLTRESKLKEDLSNCMEELLLYKEKILRISEEIDICNKEYQKINIEIGSLKAKQATYIDMENHHEGFNKGVREILKSKEISGIHGAFGELIKLDEKYEKAIEASLGAAIQNVVVKDESIAKQSIDYLKKNNLGRVTFLPMSIMKGTKFDISSMKSSVRPIGVASDLIRFDEQYRGIVDSLLGRVVVIDSIDNAIIFAKDTNHRYRVVTLDGDILNPGGSMTGGSLRSSGNILSRKRIINELEENIKKSSNNLKETKLSIDEKIKMKEELKNKRNLLLESKNRIEGEKISLETQIKMIETSLEKRVKTIEISKDKLSTANKELSKNKEICNSYQDKLDTLSEENNTNNSNIESLAINQKQQSLEFEEIVKIFNDKNIELARLKQLFENNILELERIKSDIEISQKRELEIKENIEISKSEIEALKTLAEKYKSEYEKEKSKYEEISKMIESKKEDRQILKEKFEDKKSVLRNKERDSIESKEEKFKLDSKMERNKSSRDNLLSNLFDKYEMTLVQALEFRDPSIKIDHKRIEKLRKAIKELGNVNIDSIKEYEEVKLRHDYYRDQKNDLEEAIISLNELIDDLVENMEKEFLEKFEIINENFKNVYQKLFGGGKADLKLSDKENVLSCDIDITAQPPGKKMKNLSLLSGGEKALTAICILFAILISKPTPFCILDEIEAPLDDVNVYRFGEYLKELSSSTQFIAVTHRRGTMEVADYIYGITMQEKGVSSVISLKLKEAAEIIDK